MTSEKPPLALSIDDSCSRIFINDLRAQGKRIAVYLNCAELQKVVAYDIEAGHADVQVRDNGKVVILHGRPMIQRLYGSISVSIVDV